MSSVISIPHRAEYERNAGTLRDDPRAVALRAELDEELEELGVEDVRVMEASVDELRSTLERVDDALTAGLSGRRRRGLLGLFQSARARGRAAAALRSDEPSALEQKRELGNGVATGVVVTTGVGSLLALGALLFGFI